MTVVREFLNRDSLFAGCQPCEELEFASPAVAEAWALARAWYWYKRGYSYGLETWDDQGLVSVYAG